MFLKSYIMKAQKQLMRLDGDSMIINIKDTIKYFGISIISFCTVIICTLFINYYFDILETEDLLSTSIEKGFYEAQVVVAKLLSMVCGSILMFLTIVLLIFYIKQYIDKHKKELGILKALGYSNLEIARSFWVLGLNVFMGTACGFAVAFMFMDKFYDMQNKDSIIIDFEPTFHVLLLLCFVIVPSIAFGLISVLFAKISLRRPVIGMLKEMSNKTKKRKANSKSKERGFMAEMRSVSRRSNKILVFFIMFASLCFASISQASFAIKDYSSDMMGFMILFIGLTLSITMMIIAVSTVINENKRSIAMMRAFGYSDSACYNSVLGCYRPLAYIGFVIGTGYQYCLMKLMIDIAFADFDDFESYELDIQVVMLSIMLFIFFYELSMKYFSGKLKNITIKNIMIK